MHPYLLFTRGLVLCTVSKCRQSLQIPFRFALYIMNRLGYKFEHFCSLFLAFLQLIKLNANARDFETHVYVNLLSKNLVCYVMLLAKEVVAMFNLIVLITHFHQRYKKKRQPKINDINNDRMRNGKFGGSFGWITLSSILNSKCR